MTTGRTRLLRLLGVLVAVLVIAGCRQDRELTRMQSEVTEAASDLVKQDATARREIVEMQSALDKERRLLNERERQDPIIAEAIQQIGGLALCLLPLFVVAWLLARSRSDSEVTVLDELVIDELLVEERDKPRPKQLVHRDLDALVQDRLNHHRD